jgi:serine-type D-Ala-D-Ala carboxypeptidase (penicillin-binding protein 5/6)
MVTNAAVRRTLLVMHPDPRQRGSNHIMRKTARIVAATAAAAVVFGGGIAAWAAMGAGSGPRPVSYHAAAIAHRQRAPEIRPRPPAGPAFEVSGAPQGVKAKGAVLADALTGQLLWSRGLDTERPMASVTKVMTALVVLESGGLDQEIRVPQAAFNYAWHYGGETASLRPGDELTVQELLEALLLPSGADAAYTLANAYGPGLGAFIARMNATAARMGMAHTHFTSPDGLPYPTETSTYSTPSDLLTLGLAAIRFPVFRSIVDQQFFHLPKGPGHHQYWWYNTDDLVSSYPGAVGIKDGYTDGAGHCLLFEAVRNGRTLIGVVLGSPASGVDAGVQDAARILNWGFSLKQARAPA